MKVLGIRQGECESWVEGDQLFHLCNGKISCDLDMPPFILDLRRKELKNDDDANDSIDRMGIFLTDDERLLQFCKCRYGGYDDVPDTIVHQNTTPDYWNCGKRGSCNEEFSLCKPIVTANGKLSRSEIVIIKLIAQDLADKQIADKLQVTENTIHTHRYNITKKIGCSSKNGIVAFAYEKGILNSK